MLTLIQPADAAADPDAGTRGLTPGLPPEHHPWRPPGPLAPDEPVASWELALRPGEDPRLLGEAEFYGFGVDAGKACLVDAAADRLHDSYVHVGLDEGIEVTDPGSGANGFVFASGWGDGYYPVWIGRTAAGEVVCFVADMLVLDDATVLP